MFLSAGFGCSNRRRMTDLTVDSEFFHQVHKPLHRPSRFDPYAHRTWKRGIKLPHAVAFVRESLVHNFSRRGVQHRQRLLASMQVTSYNPHLGLLRSEHCWGEHRTVYSDRREAGAVMASIRPFRSGCGGPILGPCRRSSTRLVLSQAGAALCQLGTIFDFKTLELVAAHTGTKAGLSDSILVTQPGVSFWGRQEFHANSKKIRHPLC